MQINGPSQVNGAQSLAGLQRAQSTAPQKAAQPLHGADQLDISPEAELVSRINDMPDVRADRVAEIRSQIEAGTYETEDKLNVAVGRLFDELG